MEVFNEELQTQFDEVVVEQNDSKDVCAIIFKVNNPKFNIKCPPYELQLFGKKMVDYVKNAVFDAEICMTECQWGEDVLEKIKQNANSNCKYTIVLFSDTPLFRHKTFLQIMEYFEVKKLLALRLTRGFVFQTQYLMSLNNLNNLQLQYFEEEDFITCSNLKQVALASEVLKNRILDFFMKNGVVIKDPSTTFIDAEVDIAPNTIIEPFNTICGKTLIEAGVTLNAGNKLCDAIVCENSVVDGAVIINSMVGKNCYVGKGAIVKNKSKIDDGICLPEYCSLNNVKVTGDDVIESFVSYQPEGD